MILPILTCDCRRPAFVRAITPLCPVPSPYYMAGYFRSAVYRHEIERVSPVYTTRANMNVERLSEVMVCYPEKDLQDKLGEMLIEQFITYPILCVQEGEGNK